VDTDAAKAAAVHGGCWMFLASVADRATYGRACVVTQDDVNANSSLEGDPNVFGPAMCDLDASTDGIGSLIGARQTAAKRRPNRDARLDFDRYKSTV
jgi:hypothetical protein